MLKTIGLIAAIILPFWNIPLIYRITKRKSSKDMSIAWALGVWVCIVAMLPAAILSPELTWRIFNVVNFILFTAVVVVVLKYRNR